MQYTSVTWQDRAVRHKQVVKSQTLKNPSLPTDRMTGVGLPRMIMLAGRICVIMLGCADLLDNLILIHALALFGEQIPDHDVAIQASRNELVLLLADGDRTDCGLVQVEGEELLIGIEAPYKNLAIFVAGIDLAAMEVDVAHGYIFVLLLQVLEHLPALGRYDADVLINATDEELIYARERGTVRIVDEVALFRDRLAEDLLESVSKINLHHY